MAIVHEIYFTVAALADYFRRVCLAVLLICNFHAPTMTARLIACKDYFDLFFRTTKNPPS